MESFEKFLSSVSGIVWGPPLLVLLLFTHLYLTIRLRLIQRYLGKAIKLSFSRKREGEGEIGHFGALMTALAATVGTGNIVGVGTAVMLGGPGAVLWMWLTGVFGIATKYGEAVLSIKYRVVEQDGTIAGGPMYVLQNGMNARFLGVIFAACAAIAALGIGNAVQANAISKLSFQTLGVPLWMSGVVLAVITALVMLGGVRSIARACEKLVPFMVVFYVIGCLVLIIIGWESVPGTLRLIVTSAFTGQAAMGGFAGASIMQAIRFGVARGLFSNESGLGSAPIIAAAAQTKNPVRQALVSSTGTFWDTVVVCLLTGIVLVNSGEWMKAGGGDLLTKAAFERVPVIGPVVLNIALFTFVYSTILGWSYYGEKAVEFLFGKRAIQPYRVLWVIVVFFGAIAELQLVWDLADIANALMAIPNLISLIVLTPVIVAETKNYLWENRLDT